MAKEPKATKTVPVTCTVVVGSGAVQTVVSAEYDDVRLAQRQFWDAGENAEIMKKKLKNSGTPVTDWVGAEVYLHIDGGSVKRGGNHSTLVAEFSVPKVGGLEAVIECIKKAFGQKQPSTK